MQDNAHLTGALCEMASSLSKQYRATAHSAHPGHEAPVGKGSGD
jgi:hypothetical protein